MARTPAQIAAIDHFIKREESLANAEGHAAVLRLCLSDAELLNIPDAIAVDTALTAGALALTERAALAEKEVAYKEHIKLSEKQHQRIADLEAENTRLRAELAEARSERQREHDLRVTLAGEVESLRETLATCDEPNEGGFGYCGICGHEHKCM